MHAHFVGDDVCERGLSEPGRSEEEQMVERFAALARRTDEDVELFAHGLLAHVLGKMRRAQGAVDVFFVGALRGGIDDAFVHDKHSLSGEHFEGLTDAVRDGRPFREALRGGFGVAVGVAERDEGAHDVGACP